MNLMIISSIRSLKIVVAILALIIVALLAVLVFVDPPGAEVPADGRESKEGKEDLIRVFSLASNDVIASPFTARGEARGYWFFEASFPVRVFDEDGTELGVGIATAQSEWMTEEFVPFEVTVTFDAPSGQEGTVVFEKDNPSGLPEHADELRIPVRF